MSDDSFADFRQPDGRFAKGNPGGPGRSRARERIAALDQRVAEAGEDLIDAALKVAKDGNVRALEMLLDRIWPRAAGGRWRSTHRRSAARPISCRRRPPSPMPS